MVAPLIGPVAAPDLHVMTYNVRRRIPHINRRSPDRWTPRSRILRRLLRGELPTVLGVQEALPDQVQFIDECLGTGYQWVGRGRNANGNGEHCAIFYDSHRLTLLDWSQKALSSTPDVPGSRSFGNRVPRVAVLAHFADRVTGTTFLVVNTHFDHLSTTSRLRSAEMLWELVSSTGMPTVLLGDANTSPGSRPYLRFTGTGQFRDAWIAALQRLTPAYTTFSNYRQPRISSRRIDWILVSGAVSVLSVGINTFRLGGRAASDHEAVQAVLRFDPPAETTA